MDFSRIATTHSLRLAISVSYITWARSIAWLTLKFAIAIKKPGKAITEIFRKELF
jgi:hypothetical protein